MLSLSLVLMNFATPRIVPNPPLFLLFTYPVPLFSFRRWAPGFSRRALNSLPCSRAHITKQPARLPYRMSYAPCNSSGIHGWMQGFNRCSFIPSNVSACSPRPTFFWRASAYHLDLPFIVLFSVFRKPGDAVLWASFFRREPFSFPYFRPFSEVDFPSSFLHELPLISCRSNPLGMPFSLSALRVFFGFLWVPKTQNRLPCPVRPV